MISFHVEASWSIYQRVEGNDQHQITIDGSPCWEIAGQISDELQNRYKQVDLMNKSGHGIWTGIGR